MQKGAGGGGSRAQAGGFGTVCLKSPMTTGPLLEAPTGGPVSWGRAWRARRGSEQWEPQAPTCPPICPEPLIFMGTEITDRALGPAHSLALYQGHPEASTDPVGLGLGFSICTPQLRTLLYVPRPLRLGRETGPKSQSARGLPRPKPPPPPPQVAARWTSIPGCSAQLPAPLGVWWFPGLAETGEVIGLPRPSQVTPPSASLPRRHLLPSQGPSSTSCTLCSFPVLPQGG